jgi:hypothetical protein
MKKIKLTVQFENTPNEEQLSGLVKMYEGTYTITDNIAEITLQDMVMMRHHRPFPMIMREFIRLGGKVIDREIINS